MANFAYFIDYYHKVLNGDRINFEREAQFWRITLELGLSYEQMYLKWLDETITKIESF